MRLDAHFDMLPERAFQRTAGRMTLEGGKGGSAPPPPNYAPMQAASDHAANLGYKAAQEDLAFRKQVYNDSKPREQQLIELANDVARQQMGIADANEARATEQWDYYNQAYKPNEMQTIGDAYGMQHLSAEDQAQMFEIMRGEGGLDEQGGLEAMRGYATKAENAAGEKAMTQANADVNSAAAQQTRGLQRMGGDPNKMAAYSAQLQQGHALTKVGAANTARDNARGQMMGLRSGVANFGRNMPNTAGQAFGLATQAGSSAVGNQQAGHMAGLPYAQFASGAYGTQLGASGLGMQGALGMGGLQNQGYGMQLNYLGNQQAGEGAMLGGLIGAAGVVGAAALSDRATKQDVQFIGKQGDLRVYRFRYKPEFRDEWGHDWQVGVMADEVQELYPNAVFEHPSGYKMVDYSQLG
jgi:hypothetical protein